MDNLPKDPAILLSYINTKLRDNYASLDELCDDLAIDPTELKAALAPMDVEYIPAVNQFK
ncbi:MAG: DUF4250 domain-containing protein [Muribaculaceae bacterium]|nr:DUF4250 domain-containing protein [Muribaculaceae bacterium]